MILDRSLIAAVPDVFDDDRRLAARPEAEARRPAQDRRPDPRARGRRHRRPVAAWESIKDSETYDEEDDLEDLLLAGERIALEHRLDLMNARAQLYDAWRQIRVTANALKGVLNVALTNQILTPPTTTNPFAFVEPGQAVLAWCSTPSCPWSAWPSGTTSATALINYQRQRRSLQNQEDFLKIQLRQRHPLDAGRLHSATRSPSGTSS